MKLIIDSAAAWDMKYKVWNFMENHPLFQKSHLTLPIDEQRRIAYQRALVLFNAKLYDMKDLESVSYFDMAIALYDYCLFVKYKISFDIFPFVLGTLGTERVKHLIKESQELKIYGCFALTGMPYTSGGQTILSRGTQASQGVAQELDITALYTSI
jgi:acyl-CoA oxidase